MSTYLAIRPNNKEVSGGYTLVEEDTPVAIRPDSRRPVRLTSGNPLRIWFKESTGDVVREELRSPCPFQALIFDADGTLFESEGPKGFFATAWRALQKEAGMMESDDRLDSIRKLVYRWERDLPTSTFRMMERIRRGKNISGETLPTQDRHALAKMFDSKTIRRWAEQIGLPVGEKISTSIPRIWADRKEQIGAEMLQEDPQRVVELAPIRPGAQEVFRRMHGIKALASASRRDTTLMPILEAHAKTGNGWLLNGLNGLVFGEGDYAEHCKPERGFYEHAAYRVGYALHESGRLPPGGLAVANMLYVGDTIAKSPTVDAPGTRKGMSHIVLQPGRHVDDNGPLSAVVSDMQALAEFSDTPMRKITNTTLQRLKLTLV